MSKGSRTRLLGLAGVASRSKAHSRQNPPETNLELFDDVAGIQKVLTQNPEPLSPKS